VDTEKAIRQAQRLRAEMKALRENHRRIKGKVAATMQSNTQLRRELQAARTANKRP